MNILIAFLVGLAIGTNFMAWYKDRNSKIVQSGRVARDKPWPERPDMPKPKKPIYVGDVVEIRDKDGVFTRANVTSVDIKYDIAE